MSGFIQKEVATHDSIILLQLTTFYGALVRRTDKLQI